MDRLPPITPGELLQEEFLQPLGVSQYRLAKAIGVPASRISEIVRDGPAGDLRRYRSAALPISGTESRLLAAGSGRP